MPRKKTTVVATSTPAKGHKRSRSSNADATPTASRSSTRVSKRLKESAENTPVVGRTTATKSKYFDGPASDEEEEDDANSSETSRSGFEEDDGKRFSEFSDESSESEEYESEESMKPKKVSQRKPKTADNTSLTVGEDLWREGVKTGLGPGKQVFIAKPKPKGDRGIKYVPDRIHPNTMEFLADLKRNNDREWLKRHDPDYRQSWQDWQSMVETLTQKIAEVDETIPELPPKDLVFRIYRDVRFSSDPTPYKPHFSAAWSRTGRKGPYAAYYVQVQPGGRSFVGSGLWHPDAQPLALLRQNIDRRPERIRSVLVNDLVRKRIFGGIPKDEKKAIKAFCNQNTENALKTKPKGYEVDHANIELLRLRNFTIGKKVPDDDIASPNVVNKIMDIILAMHPFVTYLNSVVMPDEDEDEDEEGEADQDSESNDDDDQDNDEQEA